MAAPANNKTICATTVSGFSTHRNTGFPSNMPEEAMGIAAARAMMSENRVLRGTSSLRIFSVAKSD